MSGPTVALHVELKETNKMKTLNLTIAATAAVVATVLPRAARADGDVVVQTPPPQTEVVQPAPAQPSVVGTAPQGTVTREKTTSEASGPSMGMVASGIGIFALSYIPAIVVAGESNLGADKNLYVPIVGPWIDLGQRPGCTASDCNGENTAKVAIVVDGVFQAVGAISLIGGLLTPAHETTTVQTADSDLKPTLHLAPAQMGAGGYGMQAFGRF
jgi:hypothetical protein